MCTILLQVDVERCAWYRSQPISFSKWIWRQSLEVVLHTFTRQSSALHSTPYNLYVISALTVSALSGVSQTAQNKATTGHNLDVGALPFVSRAHTRARIFPLLVKEIRSASSGKTCVETGTRR